MKKKATPVFRKPENKIQADMRQETMSAIPAAKEGETRADRSIPPAKLKDGYRKGKSMLHIIDEGPRRYVSDAQDNRIKDDT